MQVNGHVVNMKRQVEFDLELRITNEIICRLMICNSYNLAPDRFTIAALRVFCRVAHAPPF